MNKQNEQEILALKVQVYSLLTLKLKEKKPLSYLAYWDVLQPTLKNVDARDTK